MHTDVDLHVFYRVANSVVRPFPFPHVVVDNVFPPDYYQSIRTHLPPKEAMKSLKDMGRVSSRYPDGRLVLPLTPGDLGALPEASRDFWLEMVGWMLTGAFAHLLLSKFGETVHARLGDSVGRQFYHEVMLVQDYSSYSLGPHTDKKEKVISLLFYLPGDAARSHLGTSVYVPKDGKFRCPGGPHYVFDRFKRVYTMSYLPNTLFAFPKTDNSFHGVEPLTETDVRRDLLLYDIFVNDPPEDRPQETAAPAAAGKPA